MYVMKMMTDCICMYVCYEDVCLYIYLCICLQLLWMSICMYEDILKM